MDSSTAKTDEDEFHCLGDSPRKCNLSFSFNFDFEEKNSDDSSDSETAGLQIDVSEIDDYDPSTKHKREALDEASVLNEMEEEIERQLDAKAAKTNLTATNVKNILKHVITNEHVKAMVQKRLQDAEEDIVFEPKLTRAKAKELAAAQVNIPWPLTPVKKAASEVQVLIEEELPEDSSDEEYNPDSDKQSDDGRETENSVNSDVDSQPPTPVNHNDNQHLEQPKDTNTQYDPEGVFKIPDIPHVPTEEESIGQRTRSKLCLSETPLEQIEQAFIPPDITTDMYDWDCEVDEDWDNFLKEFTQPLVQDPVTEDDPEADPEYNILDDEETDLLDKEELRADKAVKVTRKELNNLIAELFEFTDTYSKQQQQQQQQQQQHQHEHHKKKKALDTSCSSIENNSLNCSMVDLLPALAEPELPKLVNLEQRHLLATQFRQHVQLLTQHFAITYMHPQFHSQSKICKDNLNSLRYLSNGPNSAFNADNLTEALKLVSTWETKFLDTKFSEEYKTFMKDEEAIKKIYNSNRWKYTPKFHPELEKLLMESKALTYPHLLPESSFRFDLDHNNIRKPYLKSEENLIALGLEQFLPFVASRPRLFKRKNMQLMDAVQLIVQYLLPCRDPRVLFNYIRRRCRSKDLNPISHYFEKGCAPRTIHIIMLECELKAPKDHPIELLPTRWQNYLNAEQPKMDQLKRKHILKTYSPSPKNKHNLNEKIGLYPTVPGSHPLCSPIVNMLPKILPAKENSKLSTARQDLRPVNDRTTPSDSAGQSMERLGDNKSVNLAKDENSSNVGALKDHKVFKESNETLTQLPQLRRTPRLAKIRSAQNMKRMAKVLNSKGLSGCDGSKIRSKANLEKEAEGSNVSSKVDNEDEIAELMLASTTIKKDSLSRRKAKEAREMENIRRLLESENPLNEEERHAKFAASYLQKLHVMVESSNSETFKSVIKLYLDYNEKLEKLHETEDNIGLADYMKCTDAKEANEDDIRAKDRLIIDLYNNVCDKLKDYPEMCSEFLLFLTPRQAAIVNKSVEYVMLRKMSEFINVAQIYFAKQPSRLAKIIQAITQLSSDPYASLESVNAIMGPILKGHPLIMDLFLQVLPTGKPPESLFAPHMFESLTCPLGPHDKSKVYAEDAPELYENIELPSSSSQEDPYGGDNCKCNCHNANDLNSKNITEHCVSCGTRFLNGKIYLQTPEGLRPAKITFPGEPEEKLEQIARVSLKSTEKLVSTAPSKPRRKSSKNEPNVEDASQKQCPLKNSPLKEIEENEKTVTKNRRGPKTPSKSGDQKKTLKRLREEDIIAGSKRTCTAHYKNKRERRIERKERKVDDVSGLRRTKSNQSASDESDSQILQTSTEEITHESLTEKSVVEVDVSKNSTNITDDGDNPDKPKMKPWTREEDMVLLKNVKKEYSEKSFVTISKLLGHRTVEEVKERCQLLLSLLEKMA